MFKLLRYLKKYKKESILAPVFKLIEVVFELTVPLIVARLIDGGIAAGDRMYLFKMCGILGVFAVCGLACALSAQYFAARAAVGFSYAVRRALFSHIGRLSYRQLDRVGAPTLLTRLTGDVNQVQAGVHLTLRLLLRSPIVVIGAVALAFAVDAQSAVVFAVAVPILAVVVFAVMFVSIPLYKKIQQKLDGVLGKTRENLSGTRVVRAFCKEQEEIADFNEKNRILNRMQLTVGKLSAVLNPVTFILINAAVAVLIYIGAIRVNGGAMTSGEVVAQYNYMSQILIELIKLASLIISVTKAIASGNRIQTVLEIVPEETRDGITPTEKGEYAVTFRDVSFSYGGGENALKSVNLAFPRGKTVGIIGSTGSGKSTLVNLIPRFYTATGGEVAVNGVDVKKWDRNALRGIIGVVSQKKALFGGTVRENMKIGKQDADDGEIWQALETAQAKQMVVEKGGLDFVLEQGGKNLSGGQRQRLTIARALVRKPEILILDDAASALDYATGAALSRALRQTDFAPTVISVSQRVSAIRNADLIIVLDDGAVAGTGTHDTLLEACEVYREICASQPEGAEQI